MFRGVVCIWLVLLAAGCLGGGIDVNGPTPTPLDARFISGAITGVTPIPTNSATPLRVTPLPTPVRPATPTPTPVPTIAPSLLARIPAPAPDPSVGQGLEAVVNRQCDSSSIHREESVGIEVLDLVACEWHVLTLDTGDSEPRYSPDGRYLAFLRTVWEPTVSSEVYVLDFLTGELFNASRTPDDLESAIEWSPDSTAIALRAAPLEVARMVPSNQDVRVIEIARPGRATTLAEGGDCYNWEWSPDGRNLILVDCGPDEDEIRIVNRDGTDLRTIPAKGAPPTGARWSPQGDLIAYVCEGDVDLEEKPHHVCVADPQGNVVETIHLVGLPTWSIDGMSIRIQGTTHELATGKRWEADRNRGWITERFYTYVSCMGIAPCAALRRLVDSHSGKEADIWRTGCTTGFSWSAGYRRIALSANRGPYFFACL